MKVIIHINALDYGGISKVFINLTEGLRLKKIDATLTCFENKSNYNKNQLLKGKGILQEIFSLSNYIIKNNIDVIVLVPCVHILGIKLYCFLRKKRIRIITTIHMRPKLWLFNKSVKSKIINSLILLSIKISNDVISVSKGLSGELIEKKIVEEKKLTTIYNPIIKDKISPHPLKSVENKEIIDIVIVGWIYELKGQHVVVQALKELDSTRYRLNIVGGILVEDYYNTLLHMIEQYELKSQVNFIGTIENVKEYLQSMDVYVLASHSEALPTVLIEALECGIPIISSNCMWGPQEILEEGKYGVLYEFGDVKSLAREINKLTTDDTIYNAFRQNSYLKANEFREDRIIELYYQLITR